MAEESEIIDLALPPEKARLRHAVALLVTLAGLAYAIYLAGQSNGFYHDDDITHYLFARNAWHSGKAMWHWWARPGYNLPTMVAVHFGGVWGARLFSAVQTAAVAFLAYLIAVLMCRKARYSPWVAVLAPALVWAQPLTMTLAITTLTETPAALYLTLATWLYLRGNRIWACAALSACFITRIEMTALAGIFALAIVYDALRDANWDVARMLRTRWVWLALAAMLWAPLMQIVGSAAAQLRPGDSVMELFSKHFTDEYGQGRLTHFTQNWLYQAGAGTAGLAVAGMLALRRRALLVTALTLGLLAVHTVIFFRGSFASGGYPRFLVPLSGLTAALAACAIAEAARRRRYLSIEAVYLFLAAGLLVAPRYSDVLTWDQAFDYVYLMLGLCIVVGLLRNTRFGPLAGMATVGLALGCIYMQDHQIVHPLLLRDQPYYQAVADVMHDVDHAGRQDHPALTTHVLVPMLHEPTKIVDDAFDAQWRWERAPAGTIFLWDDKYGGKSTTTHPVSMLHDSLTEHGKLLASVHEECCWVEAYERKEDGQENRPIALDR